MEDHSEPLLDSARGSSSEMEEGTMPMRENSYAPVKFYEKKVFLWASAMWFTGSLLLFASALLLLHARSRGGHDEIYCTDTMPELDFAMFTDESKHPHKTIFATRRLCSMVR